MCMKESTEQLIRKTAMDKRVESALASLESTLAARTPEQEWEQRRRYEAELRASEAAAAMKPVRRRKRRRRERRNMVAVDPKDMPESRPPKWQDLERYGRDHWTFKAYG